MKWALVGASDIAATRMIPAMRAVGDDVVGVMSANDERAARYAADHGLSHASASLDQAMSWDVDAVYVSTTNQLHAAQATAAAKAGKHVLCEKPLALTIADAQALVDTCAEQGVTLATNHHIRNNAAIRTIRDLTRSGEIGDLVAVRLHHAVSLPDRLRGWRIHDREAGAGVILDITVHDADTVRFVTGREVTWVSATASGAHLSSDGVEDSAMCLMTLADGVLAMTHESFAVPNAYTALELHGTDGSIYGSNVLTQDPVGTVTLRRDGDERDVEVPDRPDLYQTGLRAFRDAVAGQGAPAATGEDGVASLAVALTAKSSARLLRGVSTAETLGAGR